MLCISQLKEFEENEKCVENRRTNKQTELTKVLNVPTSNIPSLVTLFVYNEKEISTHLSSQLKVIFPRELK